MRKVLFFIVSLVFVSQSFAATSGIVPIAYYSPNSPVISINGMGEAGVALPDGRSAYFNPASIAFPDGHQSTLISFMPKQAELLKTDFNAHKLNFISLQQTIWTPDKNYIGIIKRADLGIYHCQNLLQYSGPLPTIYNEEKETVNAITIGIGASNGIDVGVGFTAKWLREKWYTSNSYLVFDFGFLAGVPISPLYSDYIEKGTNRFNVYPTFGISYSNIGKNTVEKDGNTGSDLGYVIHIQRIGAAMRLSLDRQGHYGIESLFRVIPSYERERRYWKNASNSFKLDKYGVELSIMEIVDVRLGNIELVSSDSELSTSGFSFNTRGLFRVLNKVGNDGRHSISKILTMDMNVQFSYAQRQGEPDDVDYFEVKLMVY